MLIALHQSWASLPCGDALVINRMYYPFMIMIDCIDLMTELIKVKITVSFLRDIGLWFESSVLRVMVRDLRAQGYGLRARCSGLWFESPVLRVMVWEPGAQGWHSTAFSSTQFPESNTRVEFRLRGQHKLLNPLRVVFLMLSFMTQITFWSMVAMQSWPDNLPATME